MTEEKTTRVRTKAPARNPSEPREPREKRQRRRLSLVRFVTILVLVVLCLTVLAGAGLAARFTGEVERRFGPPGPNLTLWQEVMYSARLLAAEETLTTPKDPTGVPRPFEISLGESVDRIAYRLEMEGLIGSSAAFRTFLIYAGLDTAVQAGEYTLSPSMTTVEIARALQDPTPGAVDFNILPGWRAEEIAAALPTSGLAITPDEFMERVNNPAGTLVPAGAPEARTLEGFLMPGTYEVPREATADDLVDMMLRRFEKTVTADLLGAYSANGLSLYEAVTLASLVQREAVVVDEQPTIASVFYNRIYAGMRLDSDPTVQYALGTQTGGDPWWKSPLSTGDLQVDSEYNTYRYIGLPPGPIANPAIDALTAVAYPERTDFYYFRAQCDGSRRHFFAVTYEEHLQNACP